MPVKLTAQQARCHISGTWMNDANTRDVTISAQGNAWVGKLAWASEQNAKIGFPMFQNFHYNREFRGTLVQPDSGHEVSATITFNDDGTLKVTGYKGIFHKSYIWHRVGAK